jgi:hypothetical protein
MIRIIKKLLKYSFKSQLCFMGYFGASKCVPIAIYQMGKVGSTTFLRSLEECGLFPVFHMHMMNPQNIEDIRREHVEVGMKLESDNVAHNIYNYIIKNNKPINIISPVRDPISRNISAFFQNYRRFTGSVYKGSIFKVDDLNDIFLRNYKHNVPLEWFDAEMKEVTGIDVYKYEFPRDVGWQVIEKGNSKLLVFKCDLSDGDIEGILSRQLGLDEFKIIRSNLASDKAYSGVYREFLDKIVLPTSYVDRMLGSKYTKHFYSEEEIAKFRSRWER